MTSSTPRPLAPPGSRRLRGPSPLRVPRALSLALAVLAALVAGCGVQAAAPGGVLLDARGGRAPPGFDRRAACGAWEHAVGPRGAAAREHDSFPEADPRASCFVAVRRGESGVRADPTPEGCGYPEAGVAARLERAAVRYARVAAGERDDVPAALACELPDETRRSAARTNEATLRALAAEAQTPARAPYAAVSIFGYGREEQAAGALVRFRPGAACPAIDGRELAALSVNVARAAGAAEAWRAGVAPVITVSGGAVHSRAVEAFLLDYLLTCRLGVPRNRVLLDPCADHTHTNLRNTGRLVVELGGRTAYVLTDPGWQSDYLEEWSAFSLIGGSIDDRSLRDFGYLLGAWRHASADPDRARAARSPVGFWFTPYRFWAEPRAGLGGFTCAE